MSIPTRFTVMTADGTVLSNQSLFTISYGADLKDREVWKERFQECFNTAPARYKQPWFDDFQLIEVQGYGHTFERKDFT